jgi:hypothetical protein
LIVLVELMRLAQRRQQVKFDREVDQLIDGLAAQVDRWLEWWGRGLVGVPGRISADFVKMAADLRTAQQEARLTGGSLARRHASKLEKEMDVFLRLYWTEAQRCGRLMGFGALVDRNLYQVEAGEHTHTNTHTLFIIVGPEAQGEQ